MLNPVFHLRTSRFIRKTIIWACASGACPILATLSLRGKHENGTYVAFEYWAKAVLGQRLLWKTWSTQEHSTSPKK